jgi:phage I-like protein
LVDEAQASGKVLAAELDYLTGFAEQQGVAALKALLDGRPNIAALSNAQTTETNQPNEQDTNIAKLSADEQEAARLLGKTDKEFAALKAG